MRDAYVLVISPDEVAKMLEDADFSEIEAQIVEKKKGLTR